jgi:SAM-dependent methyltransferase
MIAPQLPRRLAITALACLVSTLALPGRAPAQSTETERKPDVIYVPTPLDVVKQMLDVAAVGPRDTVYDLGCGDGRIPVAAAARGARGVCIDIDPKRIAESHHSVDSAGVKGRVQVRQADLFTVNLRPATVVTLYLLNSLNLRLRPKLFEELRPGTRVVSHAFDMGDWAPDSAMQVDGRNVFYWVMPAHVAGTWTVTRGEGAKAREWTVTLAQEYQKATGSAVTGGRMVPLADVWLHGDSLAFTITDDGTPVRFAGTVRGTRMSGRADDAPWRATRTRAGARPGE